MLHLQVSVSASLHQWWDLQLPARLLLDRLYFEVSTDQGKDHALQVLQQQSH